MHQDLGTDHIHPRGDWPRGRKLTEMRLCCASRGVLHMHRLIRGLHDNAVGNKLVNMDVASAFGRGEDDARSKHDNRRTDERLKEKDVSTGAEGVSSSDSKILEHSSFSTCWVTPVLRFLSAVAPI